MKGPRQMKASKISRSDVKVLQDYIKEHLIPESDPPEVALLRRVLSAIQADVVIIEKPTKDRDQ